MKGAFYGPGHEEVTGETKEERVCEDVGAGKLRISYICGSSDNDIRGNFLSGL